MSHRAKSITHLLLFCLLGNGCSRAICGDRNISSGEACDDGNTTSGDGCRKDCLKVELCGDGLFDAGEACDDGNAMAGDSCSPDCKNVEANNSAAPTARVEPPLPKPTDKSVRDIDWKNRTYLINSDDFFDKSTLNEGYGNCHMQSGCNSEPENLRFKDGESNDDITERELFVRNAYFGDLTGDDIEDAVVLVSAKWWNEGPEGNIAYAFRLSGEKPKLLGQIRIGSSKAGYRAITIQIDSGKVLVQHPKNTDGDTWAFDGTSMGLVR